MESEELTPTEDKPKNEVPDFEAWIKELGWNCDGTSESNDMLRLCNRVWNTHVLPLQEENAKLLIALRNVVDACEDKNGQFRAWHQHLREMTKEAKEQINKK